MAARSSSNQAGMPCHIHRYKLALSSFLMNVHQIFPASFWSFILWSPSQSQRDSTSQRDQGIRISCLGAISCLRGIQHQRDTTEGVEVTEGFDVTEEFDVTEGFASQRDLT